MAHPYSAERFAEEHRNDLLRSAEAWRRAHPARIEEATGVPRHTVLSRLYGTPIRIARPLLLRRQSQREPATGLCACSCPPPR
jgi:hypothetical protein